MGTTKRKASRQMARPKKRTRTVAKPTSKKGILGASKAVHSFVRKIPMSTIVGVNDAAHLPYISYSLIRLSNLVNASEFTALYDQYKITYVKMQFYMRVDPGAQAAASANYPRLYWFRDLDDQTVPTSLNDFRERSNCKIAILRPDRPVTIWIKPNVLNMTRITGTAATNVPAWNQWIDIADPSLDYMGVKYAIDNLQNTAYAVDVETTMYFSCKNTR